MGTDTISGTVPEGGLSLNLEMVSVPIFCHKKVTTNYGIWDKIPEFYAIGEDSFLRP